MSTITVDGRTAGLIEGATGILRSLRDGTPSPFEGKTRRVPDWNPDGTEVKTVEQAAVLMGVTPDVAAKYIIEQDVSPALVAEAKMTAATRARKPSMDGGRYPIGNLNDLSNAVQAWGRCKPEDRAKLKRWLKKRANELDASQEMLDRIDRLDATKDYSDDMEEKVVRRVRTAAGRKRFNQPIGSIIVRDSIGKLNNIKDKGASEYDGANDVEGADGKTYHVFEDPDEKGSFYATESTGDFWDTAVGGSGMSEEDVYIALDNYVAKKMGRVQKAPNKPQDRGTPKARESVMEKSKRHKVGPVQQRDLTPLGKAKTEEYFEQRDAGKNHVEALEAIGQAKKPRSGPGRKRKTEDRDLRGTQGVTLAEALELGKRQKWNKQQRDEFLKLNGDRQADYLERVKELEAAHIDYTHDDVMEHVKTTGKRGPGTSAPSPAPNVSVVMARRAVQINRPVDAFRYTTDMQKRAQAEYDRYVDNASIEDLQRLRDELRKLAKSGSADRRQKAEATTKAGGLEKIIAHRMNMQARDTGSGNGFDASKYKRTGGVRAGNAQVGDVVSVPWVADHPVKVVKRGAITKTGRVTLYYVDADGTESRQTYKITDILNQWSAEGNR